MHFGFLPPRFPFADLYPALLPLDDDFGRLDLSEDTVLRKFRAD